MIRKILRHCGMFLFALSLTFLANVSYAKPERYNVVLTNGKIYKNYYVFKTRKDPSLLVLKKGGKRFEISRNFVSTIDSVENMKEDRSVKFYTVEQLFGKDLDTLYKLHTKLAGIIRSDYNSKKTQIYDTKRETKYSEYFDTVSQVISAKRANIAENNIDNCSSYSECSGYIDDIADYKSKYGY